MLGAARETPGDRSGLARESVGVSRYVVRLVRACLGLAALLTALLLGPQAAYAGPDSVQKAADALKSQRLYVDPDQTALKPADVDRVRAAVESASPPVFMAILPTDAAPP